MSEVVSIDDARPHMAGPVVCFRCQHSWMAVRPAGTIYMECPKCEAVAGSSFMTMIANAEQLLGDDCCGQVDSSGICCAPACIRGQALKLVDNIRLAYFLEHP